MSEAAGGEGRWFGQDQAPSAAACVVFGLPMALLAMLVKTTLRASLNESFPVTLALPAASLWLLGASRHAGYWRAAMGLGLLLMTPLLWTSAPHASALTEIVDLACQSPRWPARLTDVLAFPIVSMGAGIGGFFAGVGAAMLLRWSRWAPLTAPLHWAATLLAVAALVLMSLKTRYRPTAEEYLARLPVVAILFPAGGAFEPPAPGSDKPGRFSTVAIDDLRVERHCTTPEARSCTLTVHTTDSHEPTYEGIGCLDGREGAVLRHAAALDRWIVEAGQRRVAFRRDETKPAGVSAVEITLVDLMPFTALPGGFFFTILSGIALSLRAHWKCRRLNTSAAAQRLGWELAGTAAAVLSLLALSPWLRAMLR